MNLLILLYLEFVKLKYTALCNNFYFISVQLLRQRLGRERRRSARLLTFLRASRSDLKAYRAFVKNLQKKIDNLKRRWLLCLFEFKLQYGSFVISFCLSNFNSFNLILLIWIISFKTFVCMLIDRFVTRIIFNISE